MGLLAVTLLLGQSPADPIAQLTGYGALGVVVVGAITGYIRFRPEVQGLIEAMATANADRLEERRRMQAQIDALLSVHHEQVLPALLAAAEALRSSAAATQTTGAALTRIEESVDALTSATLRNPRGSR